MTRAESAEALSGALRVKVGGDDVIDAVTAAEIVSMSLFDAGAQAVGEDPASADQVLVAGFATVDLAEAARATVAQKHATFVLSTEIEAVGASAWVAAQRSGLEPSWIGPWHIRAPWDNTPPGVDPVHDIVIDPGVAFGHGAHPTTRLAIELMLRDLDGHGEGTTVVDLGTGTGVAAVIAARSGATVRAVEHDAGACAVARENIGYNSGPPFEEIASRIELIHGDAADIAIAPDDLVVANVTLDVQRLLAKTCAAADQIVIAGILCSQVRAMQDLYPTHVASTIRTRGEWAGIEFSSLAPRCRKNT